MNFKFKLVTLLSLAVFASCVEQEVTGLAQTSTNLGGGSSSSTSDSTCSSTNTRILDLGNKYQTTSTGRGLFSDIQQIPGTTNEAIAYDDASATGGKATIMAAYNTGTTFTKETVAGVTTSALAAGAVTGVRLGFLNVGTNAGRPIIAWTTARTTATATGALYVAMRSAAFGTSGTWTSQLIDSSTTANRNAFRAMEMSVSPADQVGIVYMDGAATTSRVRYANCDVNCNAVTNFGTMTALDTIESVASVANAVSTGIAWCKTSSATYVASVVYPGGASLGTRYALCSGTAAACRAIGGWTKVTANVVTTAAPIMQKLLIDNSSIANSKPIVIARNAGGTTMQIHQLQNVCESVVAGTTITPGGTFGGATTANAWHSVMKDSSTGFVHVVFNESTTSVSYVSTVQSVTSTAIGSVTFNAGAGIETLTLPAAGSGMGAATLIQSLNQIKTSYGSAALDFILHEGVVNDITLAPTSTSQSYIQLLPDVTGNILQGTLLAGVQANLYRNIAAATNNLGYPAVVYTDYSIGTFANAPLKYVYRGSTSSGTAWSSIVTIPGTGAPMMPSLAFDHNNKPWISYYDNTTFKYYLVTNSESHGGGDWTTYQFPNNGKTAISAAPSNDDTSVAMAYSGTTAKPIMFIANGNTGLTGLYAAVLTPSTGAWSFVRQIDTIAQGVTRIKSDFDTSGNVVLGYHALTTGLLSPRYAQLTSASANTWTTPLQLLSSGTVGREGLTIKINPSTSKPALAFFDRATGTAYYAYCSKTVASADCSTSTANWPGLPTTPITVDAATGTSLLLPTTNEGVLSAALTFRSDGTPDVSYMTAATTQALKLGTYNGSTFDLTTLKSSTTSFLGIANSTVAATNSINYAMYGLNLDSARANTGQLYNFYVGPGNYLYLTSCGD
jgi:hypothetical protein